MKTCDYLLNKGYINRKQKEEVLKEQQDQKQQGVEVEIGQILLEKNFLSVNEILEALTEQTKEEDMAKPTYIGEESKFTFDLKFLITMGTVIVSACGVYFSITGQLNELKSMNSPNRLEYNMVVDDISDIKSNGDLKLITYQLEEFKNTFSEIKTLATQLSPLATDLSYIKTELEKLKNKKIPPIDLSGIDDCKDKLDALSAKIGAFEERLTKLEKRNSGGSRF